jgi:hypothetical protein
VVVLASFWWKSYFILIQHRYYWDVEDYFSLENAEDTMPAQQEVQHQVSSLNA